MEKEKIYGIYPGSIQNVDEVNNMNASEIYLYLNYLLNYIDNTKTKTYHNHNVDIKEDIYAVEYLIYQTTRFGVELEPPKKGEHIKFSDSFIHWLKSYEDYFNSIMTNEEYYNLEQDLINGKQKH